MSTKTIIAWVNGVAKSVSVNVTGTVNLEPTIEDRIVALEQLQSPEFVKNVTLTANGWTGSASPYSQVVSIPGVTEHSKVDLQPSTEQLAIFHEKDLTFVTENENGVITVFCVGQKPTNNYTMQVTVTEVVVNE